MRLNTVFLAAAILAVVFGLFTLLAPSAFITLEGLTPALGLGILLRIIGAAYLGYAALNWMARGWTDRKARRDTGIVNLVGFGLTAVVTLFAIQSGVGAAGPGWVNFALQLLVALGFAYFIFLKPAEI